MGYYIRVLGTNPAPIALSDLQQVAAPAVIESEDVDGAWSELVLSHASGEEIAVLEKNSVMEGTLGAEEIQEFLEEIGEYEPSSAVVWLRNYLPRVNVIYAFQVLSGTDVEDGWTLLHRVYGHIWNHAGGILQSDGEGFSNEEGFTILWQFSEMVAGGWKVGILVPDGNWVHFEMDLGNPDHRKAFRSGEVPAGVRRI